MSERFSGFEVELTEAKGSGSRGEGFRDERPSTFRSGDGQSWCASGHNLNVGSGVLYTEELRPWKGDTLLGVLGCECLIHQPNCSLRWGILPS